MHTFSNRLLSSVKIEQLIAMLEEADRAILEVYNSNSFTVENKTDNSPLTEADKASHEIITKRLNELFPNIPIISEEGEHRDNVNTLQSEVFWLVDPLDGTKEFIKRNDQFTVCVALVKNKKPVFGMISVPVEQTIYYGGVGIGAYKKVKDTDVEAIHVAKKPTNTVAASRSHLSDATREYIQAHYPRAAILQAGSALKGALVAEGKVDAHPTIGSKMSLWDLAASQAIIEAAGGSVTRPNGDEILYDNPDMLIGDFIANR
jgi:3'(2'), 5'-bisphosphate nucleotidase